MLRVIAVLFPVNRTRKVWHTPRRFAERIELSLRLIIHTVIVTFLTRSPRFETAGIFRKV